MTTENNYNEIFPRHQKNVAQKNYTMYLNMNTVMHNLSYTTTLHTDVYKRQVQRFL